MALRKPVPRVGRYLTRALLYPKWRDRPWASWVYLRLYLLGKAITDRRELARLETLVAPGMTIVDVGANGASIR
jgi:hypothetical protein